MSKLRLTETELVSVTGAVAVCYDILLSRFHASCIAFDYYLSVSGEQFVLLISSQVQQHHFRITRYRPCDIVFVCC